MMAEPHDSERPITPEDSREELHTEFDMTPPPVPSVKRPTPKSTTPSLDFLRPGEAPGEIGRLGGYRILKVLGTGGMGVVFQAEDPSLKRFVALKVMKPLLAVHDNARLRFTREAQSAAAVNHDHVVRIYQVGEDHGVPFLAMELLEGEPLDTRLRREKTLPLLEVLRIGREVASGLAAAHRRGLVHRDIKPANIILEPIDPTLHGERAFGDRSGTMTPTTPIPIPTGEPGGVSPGTGGGEQVRGLAPPGSPEVSFPTSVKIVDFGLARAIEDDVELTQSGHVTGTPQYMSPEQAEGHDIDHRSDLFSLGCVMYRMLCGETPFSGRSSSALLLAIAERPHKPIASHRADVPPRVEEVINRLLAKSPNDRFQTAIELMQTLAEIERRLLAGKPLDGDSSSFEKSTTSGETTAAMTVIDLQVARSTPTTSSSNRFAVVMLGLMLLVGITLAWQRWPQTNSPVRPDQASTTTTQPSGPTRTNPASKTIPGISGTGEAAELQPLEEWLKGREVLTVSQDGRGQFKSINDALSALQPGQVVKVLDSGPYREQPFDRIVPNNTGLVSVAGTRVELTEYVPIEHLRQPDSSVPYCGWLMQTNQFRLSGIQLRAQADVPADANSLQVADMQVGGDLIIDHCRFAFETPQGQRPRTGKLERWQQRTLALLPYGNAPFTVRLTENEFSGAHVSLGNGDVPIPPSVHMTIDQNWIHRTSKALHILINPQTNQTFFI